MANSILGVRYQSKPEDDRKVDEIRTAGKVSPSIDVYFDVIIEPCLYFEEHPTKLLVIAIQIIMFVFTMVKVTSSFFVSRFWPDGHGTA